MAPTNESLAQQFGAQQVIRYANHGPHQILSVDLDQDGDADVLSAYFWNASLTWNENDGSGIF